jgi:hypothetical protein
VGPIGARARAIQSGPRAKLRKGTRRPERSYGINSLSHTRPIKRYLLLTNENQNCISTLAYLRAPLRKAAG